MSMEFSRNASQYAAMLNHLLSKLKLFTPRPATKKKLDSRNHTVVSDPWYSVDPLSHPDLQNMDQTQLGDLYFNPRCFRDRP